MQYLILILLLCLPLTLGARDNETSIDQLAIETRMAWNGQWTEGNMQHDESGFRGQFINLRLDATIINGLSVSYRQRLNKQTDRTFWDATDWLKLDWQATRHWSFSAGKQIVNEGGWEYDRAPIDLYYCSDHWYHINCYQLGVSATYKPSGKDALTLQLCNSPYRPWAGSNSYAVNLQWLGQHHWYHTSFGLNAFQRDRDGHFMGLMTLGNRFMMGKNLHLDVDYVHRATRHQAFFKDFTLSTELRGQVHPSTSIFAKYTYDQNLTGIKADHEVVAGTQMHSTSCGIEVHPFSKYRDGVRFFAVGCYSWGTNPETDAPMLDNQVCVQAGVKFRVDILEGLKWTVNKINTKRLND